MLIPGIHQKDIPHGARVLVRSALNVPVQDGAVSSTFRIREAMRTIELLRQKGARITILSHFGRDGASLAPVHAELNKLLPVSFIPALVGEKPYLARKNLEPGEALLLENTRTDPREEESDILFIEEIAAQTDLFVFDDFTAAHRRHASTTGLIEALPACAGIRFYEELTALLRITERTTRPAVAILGGAKPETKIPLIQKLLDTYDVIAVAGVLGNTLLKKQGYDVGASKVGDIEIPEEILRSKKIMLPQEVLTTTDFMETRMIAPEEIEPKEIIIDVGDRMLKALQHHLENAKTVMMNGPLGWYEKGYVEQTVTLSHLVAKNTDYSFAGGGDTIAIFEQHNCMQDWEFISTGGGSLLTYLAEGTLPVIEAFKKKLKERQESREKVAA